MVFVLYSCFLVVLENVEKACKHTEVFIMPLKVF